MCDNTELPDAHIARLQKIRKQNDPNSTSFANTLHNNIHTALKGENKFILELLQNADDAPISDNETSVHILQMDEYLVFIHTGKPFSHQDVEKICDNAQDRFTDKSSDLNKTGYKGIGFKSIFSIAKRVHIMSAKDYSFRFDEDYFAQKNTVDSKYPWPVIPLWTDFNEIPSKIIPEVKKLNLPEHATFFILTLREQEDVHQQVALFKDYPPNILFLRNISKISFSSASNKWQLSRHKINNQQLRIDIDNKPSSYWFLHHFDFDINPSIKAAMLKLKDVECPQRLKEATQSRMTLAVAITEDGHLNRIQTGRFFCSLPTQVQCEIPALINADFLLNAERTQLVENVWNKFLINKIAGFMFEWMAELAKSDMYISQILTIFPPMQLSYRNAWFSQAYQSSFEIAKNSIAFLPDYYDKNRLLKLAEACHDSTGFFKAFPEVKSTLPLINNAVKNINVIMAHIQKVININDVFLLLPSYITADSTLEFQEKILLFFNQNNLTMEQKKTLYNNIELFNESEKLKSIKVLYFKSDGVEFPFKLEVEFIHPALYKNSGIKNFLTDLGVKSFDAINFIRDRLVPMINDNKLEVSNYIKAHAFLLNYQESFSDYDHVWTVFKKIPVYLSSEKMTYADGCYLAHVYNPKFDVELLPISPLDIYVSHGYLKINSNLEKWRGYFLKLGMVEEPTLRVLPRVSADDIKRMLLTLGDLYIKYLMAQYKIESENFEIENFHYIELLDYVKDSIYASQYFWPNITKCYNVLIKNPSYLRINNQRIKILSIIQYAFHMHEVSMTENNECFKSRELFTESIDENFKPFLKIAKFPVKIDTALANYLGFNTELSLTDCLNILTRLDESSDINISVYALVLRRILTLTSSARDIEDRKKQMRNWQGRLPAHDGTLQNKEQIHCFAITWAEINPSAYWLMQFKGFSQKDLLELSAIFSIDILTNEKAVVEFVNPKSEPTIKNIINERCHYLAVIMAKENKIDAKELLTKYQNAIAKVDFVVANELFLKHKDKPGIHLQNLFCYQKANVLYIDVAFGISSRTLLHISNFITELLSLNGKADELLSTIIELPQERLALLMSKEGYTQEVLHRSLNPAGAQSLPSESRLAAHTNKTSESMKDDSSSQASSSNPSQLERQSVEKLQYANALSQKPELKNQDDDDELGQGLSTRMQSMGLDSESERLPSTFTPDVSVVECLKNQAVMNNSLPNPEGFVETAHRSSLPPVKIGHVPVNTNREMNISSRSNSNSRSPAESQVLNEIGFWAEHYIFLFLHAHYAKKYPITETHDGFMFQAQNRRLGLVPYRLIWHNKQKESYGHEGHRDFTLLKGNEERAIEIKGTVCDRNQGAVVHVSEKEWQEMKQYKNHYYLYRVFNVGKKNISFSKIKDPARAVQNNQIPIQEVKLKW